MITFKIIILAAWIIFAAAVAIALWHSFYTNDNQ